MPPRRGSPPGTSVSSYTFKLGPENAPVTCPGQDPVLDTLVARNVSSTASVTVTTAAGASASTSIPISSALGKLPVSKVKGTFGAPLARTASGPRRGRSLGEPRTGRRDRLPVPPVDDAHAETEVTVRQIGPLRRIGSDRRSDRLQPVRHPGDRGDHQRAGLLHQSRRRTPPPEGRAGDPLRPLQVQLHVQRHTRSSRRASPRPAGASSARAHGAGVALESDVAFDGVYYSTEPVRVDGVEIDPVNGGAIVLARAGLTHTSFLKADSAYLISSDAIVKIAGIPVSLHVPDYSAEYAKAKGAAECGQKAAEGISENHLASTNCLGSLKVPEDPGNRTPDPHDRRADQPLRQPREPRHRARGIHDPRRRRTDPADPRTAPDGNDQGQPDGPGIGLAGGSPRAARRPQRLRRARPDGRHDARTLQQARPAAELPAREGAKPRPARASRG